jgi:hypothetical protein
MTPDLDAIGMTAPITDAAIDEPLPDAALATLERMCRAGKRPHPHGVLRAIARLRAAERAREAEGWEDILLAPHDGTFVLVWCDHTPVVAFYAKAFGLDKEPAWRPVVEISRRLRPTHWRPLPAPPAAGGEDPMAWAGEQAKVCPECGCEEVDHRGLLTCRCPARLPAPPAPRAEVG